jgi:sec-independent protein translocase protein TatA
MDLFGMGPVEILIIVAIALVLFGPKRLPQLGKSLGKTIRSVREGLEGTSDPDEALPPEEGVSEDGPQPS